MVLSGTLLHSHVTEEQKFLFGMLRPHYCLLVTLHRYFASLFVNR